MSQKATLAQTRERASEPDGAQKPTSIGISLESGGNCAVVLLTEPEVAERLRVSLACLRRWRLERRGPRFLKVGSLVRYPAGELNDWLASLPIGGSTPGPVAAARNGRIVANA